MVEAFVYRPKFVDIRIKKPGAGGRQALPDERVCDHAGCARLGDCRAPKTRAPDPAGDPEFWWFCAEHAGEYNRRWNFFEGMSDAELAAFERAERAGHRPTWSFRAGRTDRISAAYRSGGAADPFGMFRGDGESEPAQRPRREVGRVHRMALDALGLDETATPEDVRLRYADLVKRYHPDSNGGDRSAEALLQKVIRAYQTLKAAGAA